MADVKTSDEVKDHLDHLIERYGKGEEMNRRLKMQIREWIKREVAEREALKININKLFDEPKRYEVIDTEWQKAISKSKKERTN